jgi:hypothetical protein
MALSAMRVNQLLSAARRSRRDKPDPLPTDTETRLALDKILLKPPQTDEPTEDPEPNG